MRRTPLLVFALTLLISVAAGSSAQTASPSPTPTPEDKEVQDPVKVFTEEVRLPVRATDQSGHFDAAVEIDEVLVLEDGKPQQIRSMRRVPSNVVLLLDTGGGDLAGLGGMTKSTSLTRAVALRILSVMPKGDSIAVIQSSDRAEVLHSWTRDRDRIAQFLKTKLFAAKRSRIFESMVAAGQLLSERPEGSRHVVLITDGVQTPGSKVQLAEAVKQLTLARATVHIISYTTLVRQQHEERKNVTFGRRPNSEDPFKDPDPNAIPDRRSAGTAIVGLGIRFDPAMKRRRKAYEGEAVNSEKWLTDLAAETGGTISLPVATDEMLEKAEGVAREIGSEFVLTYRPTKPLAEAKPGEYRRIEVASRRVGLYLRSRRGYFVPVRD